MITRPLAVLCIAALLAAALLLPVVLVAVVLVTVAALLPTVVAFRWTRPTDAPAPRFLRAAVSLLRAPPRPA